MSKVFVVILNYRGWRNAIECVESNARGTYSQMEMVLVDNCSGDESLSEIRKWGRANGLSIKTEIDLQGKRPSSFPVTRFEPRALTLIQTGKNLGFSAGNNRGIEYALANRADFIFLLNNDTLVESTTLETLVSALQTNPGAGAVYPLVLGVQGEIQVPVYLRPPATFWEHLLASNILGVFWDRYRYRRYLERKNPYQDYQYDRMIALPNIAIAGGALYRSDLFREVGLLDENVFMYHEEGILMTKLRQTTWVVCMEPCARLVHKGGVDNSRLPTAFLFRKRICGEMYYLRTYMKARSWQRGLVKVLRAGQYFYSALTKSSDYWTSLPDFAREYLWG